MTEQKKTVDQVQDKTAEVGIKLNNVLTSLILMVMLWVGDSITNINDTLVDLKVFKGETAIEMTHLHGTIRDHMDDCEEKWTDFEDKLNRIAR